MKKINPVISIILIIILAIVGYMFLRRNDEPKKSTFFAFDTIINLTVAGEDAQAVLDECEREIYRLDKLFNVHSPQSEISFLNENAAQSPVKVSQELYGLIKRSVEYSKDTHGAFDITIKPLVDLWDVKSGKNIVPSQSDIEANLKKVSYNDILLYPEWEIGFSSSDTKIDLGAVAKGYATDRLCEIIKNSSCHWVLLDLGGNIYCVGDREFSIGIQDPKGERGEYFRVIKVKNTSVVTGGGYERGFEKDGRYYHHIISPYDGYPADSGLESVTVKGPSSEMCDAFSTAVFVHGKDLAKELSAKNKDISFIIMDKNGNSEEIK